MGVAFESAGVVEVELLQAYCGRNLAARIRASPAWDSRAESKATSRESRVSRNAVRGALGH